MHRSIRRELGMPPISIFKDPAIPIDVLRHLLIQKEWQDNPEECQNKLFLHLLINKETNPIFDLIKETQKEESTQEEKTNFSVLISRVQPYANFMLGAKSGRIDQVRNFLADIRPSDSNLAKIIDCINGNTALILAAQGRHLTVIEELLNFYQIATHKSYLVDKQNFQGKNALLIAAEEGNIGVMRTLLKARPNLDIRDRSDNSALFLAIKSNNPDCVHCLIEAGANIGLTIAIAAAKGDTITISTLIDYINESDHLDLNNILNFKTNGFSALHLAAMYGHAEVCQLLLKISNKKIIFNENGVTPLILAVSNNKPQVIREFINYFRHEDGEEKEEKTSSSLLIKFLNKGQVKTPLDIAVQEQYLDCVKLLVENGAEVSTDILKVALGTGNDILIKLLFNHAPPIKANLELAIKYHPEIAKSVIKKISDINAVEKFDDGDDSLDVGDTPLTLAIRCKSVEIVIVLLEEYKADPNKKDDYGNSPIAIAVHEDCDEIFDILFEYPHSIATLNETLTVAFLHGKENIISLLQEKGATLDLSAAINVLRQFFTSKIENPENWNRIIKIHPDVLNQPLEDKNTFLNQAVACNKLGLVQSFIETWHVDINQPGEQKKTPLMVAVEMGRVEMIKYLLEHKPDLTIRDAKGKTVWHYLQYSGPSIQAIFEKYRPTSKGTAGNAYTLSNSHLPKKTSEPKAIASRLLSKPSILV